MNQPDFIEVQKFLSGIDYPASKNELIEHAKDKKANQKTMEALRNIPDREYDGPNAVSKAVASS